MTQSDQSANAPSLVMRRCTPQDLSVLQAFSRKTYFDTFAAMNTEENMNAYLDSAYDADVLGKELRNPDSSFFFLYADGKLAGYLKLNENDAQTDLYDPNALEIERIYVDNAFQGLGYGYYLMEFAIKIAAEHDKEFVWQTTVTAIEEYMVYILFLHHFLECVWSVICIRRCRL